MVFCCLSEDCFDSSNHSMDGHFPVMEAHSGGIRDYNQSRGSIHSKGQAPLPLSNQQQMPISMSQSAISSHNAPISDHRQHLSSSLELDDKYSGDSCSKQMGLQIGIQPKHQATSTQFSAISEHESELSVPSPVPTPRPLQRHYSVVDPKSFGTDIGRNVPGNFKF